MVGKTPLLLAPLIVGAAVLFAAFLAGRWSERAGKRRASSFIDPATHTDLMQVLHRILAPADPDLACYLPEVVKDDAVKVLAVAEKQAENRRRAELRRGY